ncbi:branched-chain amino acid ABC transporter permease [Nocardioides sp. Kera G14]|uniref:branched-chain amino acid ABC transporter permease n=1 Tax=Nocardioides sp. Kera G14 TaxID=2884264 RepID=UPI001D1197B3|nr:branched-chain amino acid ABC transporter permease [Nocardioides sp. Kera G14]UDY23407.1 branched-chain amino acid ABC transporter permease [Nocardioides sp. Kera G14]
MSAATSPAVSTAAPAAVRVARGDLKGGIAFAVLAVAVVLLAAVVPYVVTLGQLTDLVGLFTLVILGTTWNLLAGYGGMVSVGQQAYIGVGGYGTFYIADTLGVPLVLSVVLAAVVCVVIAFLASFLVFRLVGGYFAIGTWVIAEVIKLLTTQFDALGGGTGLSLGAFRGVDRVSRVATVYWLSLAVTVVVVLGTYLLMRSKVGLGLTAIRDERVAAANVGVRVDRGRRIVYLAAAAGAGLAGALIAINNLRVAPDSNYSVNYTAAMIFIVIIGGIGTIEGPVVGAVVYWVLQNQLADLGTWYMVVLGVVAIVIVLLAPQGLWGLVTRGKLQVFPVHYRVRA